MADEHVGSKDDLAERSLKYYGKWAAVAAVAPPVADMAAVGGIQLKMLNDLAKIYDVPFRQDLGKAAIGVLAGAIIPANLGLRTASFVVRTIPVVGSIVGAATLPTFYYAGTVAVGRVFKKHFASGGTLLDFRAEDHHDEVATHAAAAAEQMKPPISRRTEAQARTTS